MVVENHVGMQVITVLRLVDTATGDFNEIGHKISNRCMRTKQMCLECTALYDKSIKALR